MDNSFTAFGMFRQLFADASPGRQLIMLIILMGTGQVLISFVAMVLAAVIFNIPFSEIQSMVEADFHTKPLGLIRFFQVFQTIGLFLIPALLANKFFFRSNDSFFRKQKMDWVPVILLLFFTLFMSIPLMEQLIHWNQTLNLPEVWADIEQNLRAMEEKRGLLSAKMLAGNNLNTLLLNIVIMAILPALAEEFLFRGILQSIFIKWLKNAHGGIILASVVFSAFHMQYYGFIPRLVLGIFFGYTFYWSRNIWVPVLAHFFNNLMAVVFAFLVANNWGTQVKQFEAGNSILPVLISMITVGLLLYVLRAQFRKSGNFII